MRPCSLVFFALVAAVAAVAQASGQDPVITMNMMVIGNDSDIPKARIGNDSDIPKSLPWDHEHESDLPKARIGNDSEA